jgi:outer membrane protein assembly factor BamD
MNVMIRFFRTAVFSLTVAMSACATAAQVPDQLTAEELFERGLTALQKEDWTDAIALFERFILQFPGHPRLQEARYNHSNGYFGKREYITAANEYSRLANDYPAGPWADDARFKVCESYYKLSPKPQLDQQYTRAALDHCQSLITYYPTSDFVTRAQGLLDDLRNKLAEKSFLAGEFYYKRNAFDSAIIYYEAAARDYPETAIAPRSLFRLYETYVKLGYKEEAEATKQRLLKDYPTSTDAKQLQEPAATSSP